ncbi:MAG: diphthine--ammonia ligase [Bacteroidota bacterium]
MANNKMFVHWSSGKDASMALHAAQQDPNWEIDRLLTTVNRSFGRVSMHGLRIDLLKAQAKAIGLPLDLVELDANPSMEDYKHAMGEAFGGLRHAGYTHSLFGDIFLEDLRQYRIDMLAQHDLQCVFPLWKKDTHALLEDFIAAGFQAIVVCINAQLLPQSFCGRLIDTSFLQDLPAGVDPCGENGEFHTFCFDGPIFQQPIRFEKGEVVYKSYPAPQNVDQDGPDEYGFWYCDLLPASEAIDN